MRFMMFVATDPEGEPYSAEEDKIEDWGNDVDSRGIWKDGNRLRPTEEATTVRVRNGSTVISDGPFTESKERIVGYDVLECVDLDEAIEVASKHPMARFGRIELRPVWPLD
ncbi:YciI family protein [Arthrobacter psychrolactophilus]